MTKKVPYSFKLSPEKRAEIKKDALERRAALTLAYQLGYYVGEEIVSRYLPTLSVDSITTRKNISVTCAEGDEARRLNAVWFNKYHTVKGTDAERSEATQEEWKALRAYHKMLEEKYLPKTVECHLQLLNITENDMAEFKKGVSHSLWDCDGSHYSTNPEDIDVKADEDGWFTVITLKKSD
jgi:hypothetical protein